MAMHKKVVTSRKGRKCKQYGCTHILSIYNHEAYCHVHSDRSSEKIKTRLIKS